MKITPFNNTSRCSYPAYPLSTPLQVTKFTSMHEELRMALEQLQSTQEELQILERAYQRIEQERQLLRNAQRNICEP